MTTGHVGSDNPKGKVDYFTMDTLDEVKVILDALDDLRFELSSLTFQAVPIYFPSTNGSTSLAGIAKWNEDEGAHVFQPVGR